MEKIVSKIYLVIPNNLSLYFSLYLEIFHLKAKLNKTIRKSEPKNLIRANSYLLKKYLENAESILPSLRKLLLRSTINQKQLRIGFATPLRINTGNDIRYANLQIRIHGRILYLLELLLESSQSQSFAILDELHTLNNKTYVYELLQSTIDYYQISKLPNFSETDIFNIQDVLSKVSNLSDTELENIKSWDDLSHFFIQSKFVKFIYLLYFLLLFSFITILISGLSNSFLLIPTTILAVIGCFKTLPFALMKITSPIRIKADKIDKSQLVAVLIPVIYKNTPDFDEILKQVKNIRQAEKYANIEIFLLADEADRLEQSSDEYWNVKWNQIHNYFRSQELLGFPRVNVWLRSHTFNPQDKIYMGYERKRGKVEEFIKWSRGGETRSKIFANFEPKAYKYAFVIDEGMDISQNCISQLLGILSHPANTPIVYNSRVVQGYAIAQPKCFAKTVGSKTLFQHIFDRNNFVNFSYGDTGDVITDLWKNANFNGKGLVNLDVYSELLLDVFPENLVLSHDLLEGSKCRTVNDPLSKVFESYPTNFFSFLNRENRWMRGDMNASLFALPVFQFNGKVVKFQMSVENRIRIFLNMLSILKIICEFIFIIISPSILFAFGVVIILRSLSNILSIIRTLMKYIFNFKKISIRYISYSILLNLDLLTVYCISNSLVIFSSTVTAVLKSIYRLVTHKNLLEWSTYKQNKSYFCKGNIFDFIVAGIVILISTQINFVNTLAMLGITSVVLFLDFFFSQKYAKTKTQKISKNDREYLLSVVLDTFAGISQLMIKTGSNLPVDNVTYIGEVDNLFTSITNIGLYMLSLACVHRLDIISDSEFNGRSIAAIREITMLPKLNGNFYNWYDLYSKTPVWGKLLSSVDLGNFQICLICFREYLKKLEFFPQSEFDIIENIIKQISYKCFINEFEELSQSVDQFGVRKESYYNIWASETRIASFMAIANGDVLDRHWYKLERLQSYDGLYLSWGGGCFEYLLPVIFFKSESSTLENYTYLKYFDLSKKHSSKFKSLPWGQSESIYMSDENVLEYGPNGINETCSYPQNLKHFVVAPYATALCAGINLKEAIQNFKKIEKYGGRGVFGFYESLSFFGKKVQVTTKYMAHHQAMTICALTNALDNGFVQNLFLNSEFECLQYLNNSNINQTPNL